VSIIRLLRFTGPTSRLRRYGLALALSAAVVAVSIIFHAFFLPAPALLPLVAVLIAAWYGGFGPGLLATLLGVALIEVQFIEPFGALSLDQAQDQDFHLLLFGLLSVGVSLLAAAWRRAEVLLRQRLAQLQATYRLSQSLAGAHSLAEFYAEALTNLKASLAADRAAILVADADGRLRFRAWHDISESFRLATEAHSPWLAERAERAEQRPAGEPRTVVLPDLLRAEAGSAEIPGLLRQVLLDEGILAAAFVPLVYQGRLLGQFVLYCNRPYPFSADEIRLAETIAGHLALAIERRRAEDALSFLAEASSRLVASLDVNSALERVPALAVPALADACLVCVRLPESSQPVCASLVAGQQPRSGLAGLRLEWQSAHPLAEAVRAGQPQLLAEPAAALADWLAPLAEQRAGLAAFEPCSALVLPLTNGQVLGAMVLMTSARSGRRLGAHEQALGEQLARRAVLAIENARLYQAAQAARRQAEQSAERTARLQAITAALSQALDARQIAQVVVAQGVATLGAEAGSVALLNDGQLELAAWAGYPDELIERFRSIPLDAPVPLAEAARTGQPLWIETFDEFKTRFPLLSGSVRYTNQAWAAVPFVIEGRVLGAMGLNFNPEPGSDGSGNGAAGHGTASGGTGQTPADRVSSHVRPEDRAFVLALAEQCAQALDRARLYEAERQARLQAEAARLQAEAARMQAEAAQRRLALLADASRVLAAAADDLSTLQALADLGVRAFADLCLVDGVDANGDIVHLATACANQADRQKLEIMRQLYPPGSRRPEALEQPLLEGRAAWYAEVDDGLLASLAHDDQHLQMLRGLDMRSLISLPLAAHGQVLGVLTFARTGRHPRYTADDVQTAEELARRTATALENARLFSQAQALNAELEARVEERTQALERTAEELRELASRMEALREEERSRMAREVHDGLGSSLTALKMDASRLRRELADQPAALARLDEMLGLIDETVGMVRRIATELRPAVLDDLGLIAAIEWQLTEFSRRSGVDCSITVSPGGTLPKREAATGLYRVFQEALTNVGRHAAASRVRVSLAHEDGQLVLRVSDNGRGIDPDALNGRRSLGLVSMRERVRLLGGQLHIGSAPNQGTTVEVRLPTPG
jgi:signal transduction histidine kinase